MECKIKLMNRSDNKNLLIVSIIFLILVVFVFFKYYSCIDTTYFEKVSELDKLIFNLGKENIYYYIYLGLFNINTFIIMLLSFINTKYLIISTNIINLFISFLLFYKLLKHNKFNDSICLYGTILFMLMYISNIFNEVIYLNYLPFFILGFLSVDKYIKYGEDKLLIFSIIMIGFTNYKYLMLISIIYVFYYIYITKNTKNLFKYILLLVILNIFLSFIYLPIILNNYVGYVFNYNLEINLLILISIIMLYFSKNNKSLLLFLILSLFLNYILNIDISLFIPLYILSICILLKNIYEHKIKKETLYKVFTILIVIVLFDKYSVDYINYFFTFILIILLSKDNKISILLLILYFIIFGNINYSNKYKAYKEEYNYINYNSFNLKSYNKYSFPYKDELSLKYVIVSNSDNYDYYSKLKKCYINNYNVVFVSSEVNHIDNEYVGNGKIIIDVSSIKDKILIIKNTNEFIKINNNELNDEKYIFLNNSDKLEITFLNRFSYNDIECYYMDNDIDIYRLNDNNKFNVNMNSDGYIVTKYKYDKFFNIKIDNKKVKYYKVNDDLTGFKVPKGKHNIVISYFSYYKLLSFIISLISVFIYKYFYRKKY